MHRLHLGGLFVLAVALCHSSLSAQEPSKRAKPTKPDTTRVASSDEVAIRDGSRAFEVAFNKQDAKAIAQLWTEDGDFQDESGRTYSGRKAIQEAYAQYFSEHGKPQIKVAIDNIKLLSDTAAIEDGRAYVDSAPGAPGISKYTAVHVKVDGKWLMSTVRDTRVETPSAYRNLEDFEWLIGTWVTDEAGRRTEFTCRWVANKSFIERKYVVKHADKTVNGGVQIIGWNAQEGHVQSWNFSSDGGHGVGHWQPHEAGWAVEIRGITGVGVPTSALNVFTRLDDNTCTWQSLKRTLGDRALPDTEEVVLKRETASK